jgi:AcrR family transcriptional regulator
MARGATRGAREGGSKAEAAGRAKPRARAQPGQKTPRATGKSRRNRRALSPEARRAAILAAALEEFTARGYEGARLDDVAKRAGIAKGTIYLYFADKESLFQELVRSMVSPVLGVLTQMRDVDIPARVLIETLLNTFVREVYGTRRRDIIRLILSEGPRFPAIAEFYYREVIARVLAILRPILKRAAARGELPHDGLVQFPQLIVAPMLVAVMWHGLFDKFDPLDVDAMVRAHVSILFAERAG